MPSAFEITPREIENLSELDLVRLVNLLIRDEGRRLQLPPTNVKTSLRISDPDGGADAITDAGEREGPHLEDGDRVWQFKKRWPEGARRAAELRKRAVQAAFKQ